MEICDLYQQARMRLILQLLKQSSGIFSLSQTGANIRNWVSYLILGRVEVRLPVFRHAWVMLLKIPEKSNIQSAFRSVQSLLIAPVLL